MATDTGTRTFTLTVHPSVVFKLGEDLITDDVQALIELVKNAYDADSPSALVRIDTQVWTELRSGAELTSQAAAELKLRRDRLERRIATLQSQQGELAEPARLSKLEKLQVELLQTPEPVRGRVTILDRGDGMRIEDVELGWLTVSASRKRAMKQRGEKTRGERTPLGDKGLGRLGAQRLGRFLGLTTQARLREGESRDDAPTLRVDLFWDDFANVESLSQVPITVRELAPLKRDGSELEIRGLHAPDLWSRAVNHQLERDLATMVSPYSDGVGFRVRLWIDGDELDLRERSAQVLDRATVTYLLTYRNQVLSVDARMRIDYLRPLQGPDKMADFADLVGSDNGHAFSEWLLSQEPERAQGVQAGLGDDQHFLTFHRDIPLRDIPNIAYARDESGNPTGPIDPGDFTGRVDQVILRVDPTAIFNKVSEYRDFVRVLNGIRIYRDGFGIRVPEDWLNLASQWSSASSYYTLRPENVIGHLEISAGHNAALEETTDREDFKDTFAYRNFMRLLASWLTFTEEAQSFARAGYNAYRKAIRAEQEGMVPNVTPAQLMERVVEQFQVMSTVASSVKNARQAVDRAQAAHRSLDVQQQRLEDDLTSDPRTVADNGQAVAAARHSLAAVQEAVKQIERDAARIADQRVALDLLVDEIQSTQEQMRSVWELVSLGITAESVAHEVLNVTDRLNARSQQIARYVDRSLHDERVSTYIEHVRSAAKSLAQQVAHLDASMKYVRDRKEHLDVVSLVNDTAHYFNSRWADDELRIVVDVINDVHARVSRGKLSQVFDNLILNSEYWLREAMRTGAISAGIVTIRIDSPVVTVEDNGLGIDPTVEHSLFDPFVTRKPSQRGRGLGLFVVQQLLDSEDVAIALSPVRNEFDRRYRFFIDFSSII